jgi:cobalt-zinc-cadmium efflux system outer membrane protein
MIYLGGKKKNEIQLQNLTKSFQLQFNQLLVDLRSQLRETYYNLIYEQKSKSVLMLS